MTGFFIADAFAHTPRANAGLNKFVMAKIRGEQASAARKRFDRESVAIFRFPTPWISMAPPITPLSRQAHDRVLAAPALERESPGHNPKLIADSRHLQKIRLIGDYRSANDFALVVADRGRP